MKTKKQKQSWGALAKGLRVSRRSLLDWRKLPGAPSTPSLAAWQTFVEENALGIAPNKLSPGRERLMQDNLDKRNHLLDLEIAEKEKRMVLVKEVDDFLFRTALLMKSILQTKLENELPPRLIGKSPAEMSIEGRAIVDEICTIFSSGEPETWNAKLQELNAARKATT